MEEEHARLLGAQRTAVTVQSSMVDKRGSVAAYLPARNTTYQSPYKLRFTILLLLAIISSYIIGIFFVVINSSRPGNVEDDEQSEMKMHRWSSFLSSTTISPPWRIVWFIYIDAWPNCYDHRKQLWRLLTLQFVHSGIIHLLSNVFTTAIYGFIFEVLNGSWMTCLVFETGIVLGTLFHALKYPTYPLVGCSHGAYALIAATLAYLLYNFDTLQLSLAAKAFLFLLIFIQCLTDLCNYLLFFSSHIGYDAHISAFILSFFLSSYLIRKHNNNCFKYFLSSVMLFLFIVLGIGLILSYIFMIPPLNRIPDFKALLESIPFHLLSFLHYPMRSTGHLDNVNSSNRTTAFLSSRCGSTFPLDCCLQVTKYYNSKQYSRPYDQYFECVNNNELVQKSN